MFCLVDPLLKLTFSRYSHSERTRQLDLFYLPPVAIHQALLKTVLGHASSGKSELTEYRDDRFDIADFVTTILSACLKPHVIASLERIIHQ